MFPVQHREHRVTVTDRRSALRRFLEVLDLGHLNLAPGDIARWTTGHRRWQHCYSIMLHRRNLYRRRPSIWNLDKSSCMYYRHIVNLTMRVFTNT